MDTKIVRDIMVPLGEYPAISDNATLIQAIRKFEEAQKKRDRRRQPFRAVLVLDDNGKVVGKLGQLAFLKALEPERTVLGDMGKLAMAGVSSEFINSMMNHFRFFQENLSDLCSRARNLKVRDVMHPVAECIDEKASLGEAITKIIAWQSMSILVCRENGKEVVGLLRLTDLCQEVAEYMMAIPD